MALQTESTIYGTGANEQTGAQVDPTFQSLRASIRPLEFTGTTGSGLIGGHYALDAVSGAMAGAIAANGQMFSVRWVDTRMYFVLHRLSVAAVCTAFTAAAVPDIEIIRATSFTANASGGTSITPATSSQKVRTSTMSGSLFGTEGQIMVASTTALTAGTQTLDTAGMACSPMGSFTAAGIAWPTAGTEDLYRHVSFCQHPLVLGASEGFVLRTLTGWSASTITLKFYITMEWSEVPTY